MIYLNGVQQYMEQQYVNSKPWNGDQTQEKAEFLDIWGDLVVDQSSWTSVVQHFKMVRRTGFSHNTTPGIFNSQVLRLVENQGSGQNQ